MIRLFTSYYEERDPLRRRELITSLERNLRCPALDALCVMLEGPVNAPLQHEKISFQEKQKRPSYADFIRWAAGLDERECAASLTIIANSDIYFDESLSVLAQALKPGQCAALSRWDVGPGGKARLFDRNDSQDAWVFKGPLRDVQANFPVGVPRCDNRFLHELKRAGYEVINPAFSIRAYHLHAGQRAEYESENLEHFVEPPYAYLWPHNLWALPRTLWHNLRNADTKIGWRLDRRRLAGSLPVRALRKLFGRSGLNAEPVD